MEGVYVIKSRPQIIAVDVRRETTINNGVTSVPVVVEHPHGVPTKEGKSFVNVTDGRLSGEIRPYYNIYMAESTSLERGRAKVVVVYGSFGIKGDVTSAITWQNKIDPKKLWHVVHIMDIHPAEIVFTLATQLSMNDYKDFTGSTAYAIKRDLLAMGFEFRLTGDFITIPSSIPELSNLYLDGYLLDDQELKSATVFVFTENLLNADGTINVQGIANTFGRDRIVRDRSQAGKVISSRDMMMTDRDARMKGGAEIKRLNGTSENKDKGDKKPEAETLKLAENEKKMLRLQELEDMITNDNANVTPEEKEEYIELEAWREKEILHK